MFEVICYSRALILYPGRVDVEVEAVFLAFDCPRNKKIKLGTLGIGKRAVSDSTPGGGRLGVLKIGKGHC